MKNRAFLSSKNTIILVIAFWVTVVGIYKPWQKNQVINDVISYYAYLPATVVYKDVSLRFTTKDPAAFKYKFWPETAPNGGLVIKTTMGVSLLYAPFFLAAHAIAPMLGEAADGFSAPYQFFLLLSCLVYLIIGMVFLRKLLLLFFSEKVTALTIASVFFASNLFWYSSFNGLMSHGYLFSLTTIFTYQIVKWHAEQKLKTAIYIGLFGGLITLIRPTMILSFLVFFLYGITDKTSLILKFRLLKQHIKSLFMIGIFFFLVFVPQLIYWKYVTGSCLFFSYIGERFYFAHPHIFEGLFGFRKGWLLYTPIMLFAVLGVSRLKKNLPAFFLPIVILLPLLVYVFFSWWAWWYGGSFGLRAFVDFYGLLALPMACFYQWASEQKIITKAIITLAAVLFTCLNLFQAWQFYHGYLHHDSMTKEAYVMGFFSTAQTDEWFQAMQEPDYGRAKKGLPEAFTEEEVKQVKPVDIISFKGYNTYAVSCNLASDKTITCNTRRINQWENFSIIYLQGNKVALKTIEGKYISADAHLNENLIGNRDIVGSWETFELIYLGNNKIALKAYNQKYVEAALGKPYQLSATSETITKRTEFRILIN